MNEIDVRPEDIHPLKVLPPTPPAGIPATDHRPYTSPQYARREAVRLAIQHHRATDDAFTRTDVLETAQAFAEYIRNGTMPGHAPA